MQPGTARRRAAAGLLPLVSARQLRVARRLPEALRAGVCGLSDAGAHSQVELRLVPAVHSGTGVDRRCLNPLPNWLYSPAGQYLAAGGLRLRTSVLVRA